MMWYNWGFFWALLALWASSSSRAMTAPGGCVITLPDDIPKFEPVYLLWNEGSSYDLLKPTGQRTVLSLGSKLLLACIGNNNAIVALDKADIELECTADGFKSSDATVYRLKDLGCKSIPTSALRVTSQPCSEGKGTIFEAGFEYGSDKFAKVFEVCYDNVTEHTFYTHNILNGATIDYKVIESTRRAFRAEGMSYTTTATNTFYTIKNQIERFESVFGAAQAYVNQTMFLARGHLTPDADMIFSYEQLSTYFYMNVAPEYQIVNAGNWLRVENLARSLASQYEDDLHIYNGYDGIVSLRIPGSPGKRANIYLDDTNKFTPPLFYFKVIHHQLSDAALVLVSYNNPFLEESEVDEYCGQDICTQAGVDNEIFKDRSRGYTFCCELSVFKEFYRDLPKELTASHLLTTKEISGPVEPEPVEEPEPKPEPKPEHPPEPEAENGGGCLITMPTDILSPEPVYVVETAGNSPELLKPTGQSTTIPVGAILTAFCAGNGNLLSPVDQQTLQLKCQADKTLFSEEKSQTFTLQQLQCSRVPTSDLLVTAEQCSQGQGYVFKVGFNLPSQQFVEVFRICYDNVTEHTLYTRNIINGATLNYKIIENLRRAFRAEGMRWTTTATNTFYTINNQIERFKALFGDDQAYISNSQFMARSQLTPDADFIFGYERLSTYFYTNAAPKFQVINTGNWIRVENLARNLASEYGSDLLTFTGTLGLLRLPDSQDVLHPIYLEDSQLIKAPEWYYKILMHPQLTKSMVMITLNNPYTNEAAEFCTNVCKEYGLDQETFGDFTRGYTYCCTLDDFQTQVAKIQDYILPTYDLPEGWMA